MNLSHTLMALLIACLTGMLPVVHKHLLQKYKPMSIMILSATIYFTATFLFSFSQIDNLKSDLKKFTLVDTFTIVFLVLFCVFFTNVLYYTILNSNKSYVVSTLIDIAPLFTLIAAVFFLNEHINAIGLLGVLLTLIGVALISANEYKFEDFVVSF
jgi:drug/metabolite transporter (DMT)-like permease